MQEVHPPADAGKSVSAPLTNPCFDGCTGTMVAIFDGPAWVAEECEACGKTFHTLMTERVAYSRGLAGGTHRYRDPLMRRAYDFGARMRQVDAAKEQP